MIQLSSKRYEEIKVVVADVVEDYGLGYPLDPWELAGKLGVDVYRYNPDKVSPWLQPSCGDGGGYTVKISLPVGYAWMVFLKGSDSRERLTFTLAHELGHIILNHSCSNESYVREEQEANFFASYLLMPDIIARILFSPVSPQDVMGFCGVTASCAWEMCRRINRVYKGKYEIKDYEFRIIEAFFIQENLKAKNRLDLREIS